MKRIKRIVATVGEYTDREGRTKKQYVNIGTLFERPDGSQAIKIESIPIGWNGWASFYEIEERGNEPRSAAAKSAPAEHDIDDEIPF